jgi:hypothetical protein
MSERSDYFHTGNLDRIKDAPPNGLPTPIAGWRLAEREDGWSLNSDREQGFAREAFRGRRAIGGGWGMRRCEAPASASR